MFVCVCSLFNCRLRRLLQRRRIAFARACELIKRRCVKRQGQARRKRRTRRTRHAESANEIATVTWRAHTHTVGQCTAHAHQSARPSRRSVGAALANIAYCTQAHACCLVYLADLQCKRAVETTTRHRWTACRCTHYCILCCVA